MPVSETEVLKFIHMNIWKKEELRRENPQKYDELFKESQKKFKVETDQEALKDMESDK